MSNLIKLETCYDKHRPYFGQEEKQLEYMDCDSFGLSIRSQNIINVIKNLEKSFNFSNLSKNIELFSNKNKKMVGKLKVETPKKTG